MKVVQITLPRRFVKTIFSILLVFILLTCHAWLMFSTSSRLRRMRPEADLLSIEDINLNRSISSNSSLHTKRFNKLSYSSEIVAQSTRTDLSYGPDQIISPSIFSNLYMNVNGPLSPANQEQDGNSSDFRALAENRNRSVPPANSHISSASQPSPPSILTQSHVIASRRVRNYTGQVSLDPPLAVPIAETPSSAIVPTSTPSRPRRSDSSPWQPRDSRPGPLPYKAPNTTAALDPGAADPPPSPAPALGDPGEPRPRPP